MLATRRRIKKYKNTKSILAERAAPSPYALVKKKVGYTCALVRVSSIFSVGSPRERRRCLESISTSLGEPFLSSFACTYTLSTGGVADVTEKSLCSRLDRCSLSVYKGPSPLRPVRAQVVRTHNTVVRDGGTRE